MSKDRVIRLSADLFDAATEAGREEHRSARRQLEHWARVGRLLCAHETAERRRAVTEAEGGPPAARSSFDERRLAADIELDVAIRERAASVSFGVERLKAGLPAVARDEDGNLVVHEPDGTTRLLQGASDPHAGG